LLAFLLYQARVVKNARRLRAERIQNLPVDIGERGPAS
jgi:uncharacterized protein YciW